MVIKWISISRRKQNRKQKSLIKFATKEEEVEEEEEEEEGEEEEEEEKKKQQNYLCSKISRVCMYVCVLCNLHIKQRKRISLLTVCIRI